jgi:hypothetical protein
LGIPEIEARVFEDKGTDDFRLFSISLHENLTTRGFNTVEKAIALEKLIHHFQIASTVVVKTFLPLRITSSFAVASQTARSGHCARD